LLSSISADDLYDPEAAETYPTNADADDIAGAFTRIRPIRSLRFDPRFQNYYS
jgi:hypothetical protein